jgi:hypothetical protein
MDAGSGPAPKTETRSGNRRCERGWFLGFADPTVDAVSGRAWQARTLTTNVRRPARDRRKSSTDPWVLATRNATAPVEEWRERRELVAMAVEALPSGRQIGQPSPVDAGRMDAVIAHLLGSRS